MPAALSKVIIGNREEVIVVTSANPFRPLMLKGGNDGCLLVHGFTSSPADIRPLSQHLHSVGYTVSEVLLPGHGTTPQDMAAYGWRDWLKAVEEGLSRLQTHCCRVWVLGFSMGGVLALLTAARHELSGVVAIGAPIWPQAGRTRWAFLLRHFKKFVLLGEPGRFRHPSWRYEKVAVKNIADLMTMISEARKTLVTVTTPALIVQGRDDHTVKPASALYIFRHLGSGQKEIFSTEGGHMLLLGEESKQICRRIVRFIEETGRDVDDISKTGRRN